MSARNASNFLLLIAPLTLAVCALSACSGTGGKVVATVGKGQITQPQLAHWMEAMVGGDYRELNSETSPNGLVSDPPNYPRCLRAAKQIPTKLGTRQTDTELRLMCHQLYTAVKEQALSFLISGLLAIEQGAELGQHISDAELNSAFHKFVYRQWPNPAQFRQYLREEHRTVNDERYLLKRNLLTERILHRLERKAGGGLGNRAFATLVLGENAKWISKTECKPGYRSIQCKQYSTGSGAAPTAAVLVEHLKAGN